MSSSPPSRAYFACGCESGRGNVSHVHREPPGGRGGTSDSSSTSSTPTRRQNRPVGVVIPLPFPATAYLDRLLSKKPMKKQVAPTIELDNAARPLPAPDKFIRVLNEDSDEDSGEDPVEDPGEDSDEDSAEDSDESSASNYSPPFRGHATHPLGGRMGNLRSRSSRNASDSLNRGGLTRGSSRGGASSMHPSRGKSFLRSRNNRSPRRGHARGEEACTGMVTRAAAARESRRVTASQSSLSMPSGSTQSAAFTEAIRNRPIFKRNNTIEYSSRDDAVRYESIINPTISTFTGTASYEAGADLFCMESGVSSLTLNTSFTPFSEALKCRIIPKPITEDDPIDIESLDLSDDSACLRFLTEFIEIIGKIKFSYLYPKCKVKARVYTESLKAVIDENQDEKGRAQAMYILLSAAIEIINIDDTEVCYINFPIILKKIKMGEDLNGTVKDDTKDERTIIEAGDFNEEEKIEEKVADSEEPGIVTNTKKGCDLQKEKKHKPNNIEPDKTSSS